MIKILIAICFILSAVGYYGAFFSGLRTTYCCSYDAEGWRPGFAIKVMNEREHVLCSCAGKPIPAYHLVAIDIALVALILDVFGIFLLRVRSGVKDKLEPIGK
jgi:hypothetical protein